MILEGNVRKIDYGQVNDEVIISTLTIGILADTAVWISQEEKTALRLVDLYQEVF